MNLQSALLRATYLRTLHRFCGPYLGYAVVNVANDLCRARLSPSERAANGEGAVPLSPPHPITSVLHDAPYKGNCA